MWLIVTICLLLLFICLLLVGVAWPYFTVPHEKHRWYGPWWTYWLAICNPLLSWRHRHRIQALARDRSEQYSEKIFATQCALAMLACIVGIAFAWVRQGSFLSLLMILISIVLAFFYPLISLKRQQQLQNEAIRKDLPFSLDLLSLSLEAGMSFYSAFLLCVGRMPVCVLQKQFQYVIDDIRTGQRQEQAFQLLSQRLQVQEIDAFVSAILQSLELGSSISITLRQQAIQRRQERFLRAEKKALEAPVKMIFPLVFCIFPCTFLVIGYPLFLQLAQYI